MVVGLIDENPGIAALVLVEEGSQGLMCVGRVGDRLVPKGGLAASAELVPMVIKKPVVRWLGARRHRVRWVRPVLVADVRHRGRTWCGRHPSAALGRGPDSQGDPVASARSSRGLDV